MTEPAETGMQPWSDQAAQLLRSQSPARVLLYFVSAVSVIVGVWALTHWSEQRSYRVAHPPAGRFYDRM